MAMRICDGVVASGLLFASRGEGHALASFGEGQAIPACRFSSGSILSPWSNLICVMLQTQYQKQKHKLMKKQMLTLAVKQLDVNDEGYCLCVRTTNGQKG